MGKDNAQATKQPKNKTNIISRHNKKDVIFSTFVFIAVCALIFYPPYLRGLFFQEDIFVYHILTAIVLLLVWIDKISRKEYAFFQTPLDFVVAAYAGAYLLSLMGAIHIGEAFYGFLKALNYFMVYWVVTQMVRDYGAYVNILRVLLTSGFGVAIIGILAAAGYSKYPAAFDGKVILSTLQYSNTTAAYLAVTTLIAVTLWIREENRIVKILYALSAFIMMLVVLATLSKGAWLIFVLGALLCLLGMPGMYRIKSIYFLVLVGGAALTTAIKFLPAIAGKENPKALPFIFLGICIVILGELIWEGVTFAYRRWGNNITALALVLMLAALILSGVTMVNKAQILGHELKATALFPELGTIKNFSGSSFATRLDFNRWGMEIVRDYPINGTGAGGWNALYHSYQDYLIWTTEVHNHFLQVWIEAGTIGLIAFLSMWAFLMWLTVKRYKQRTEHTDNNNKTILESWILTWGTTSAIIAFGAHAAIDFDLSMGAMCILLWTLFAIINSASKIDRLYLLRYKPTTWLSVSFGIVLVIVMLVAGQRFTMATNLDKAGKALWTSTLPLPNDSVKEDKLAMIGKIYEQAASLDPFNSVYQAYIAQANSMIYVIHKDKQNSQTTNNIFKTQEAISKIEKLSPRDLKIRSMLLTSNNLIGDYKGMVKQAESMVEINPNDIAAYQAVIQTSLISAEYYMSNNQPTEAIGFLDKIVIQAHAIENRYKSLNPERLGYPFWQGAPLIADFDMQLSVAKAYYLLGDYKHALSAIQPYMTGAAATPPSVQESKAWYLACLYQTGAQKEVQESINLVKTSEPQTVDLFNKLISLKPLK